MNAAADAVEAEGGYIARLADQMLESDLASWPSVLVTGPRAVGKTTTAIRHAEAVLRLDRPEDASLVRDDPDAAISVGPFPLLLDEWQHTPEVLGAVKRAVDDSLHPGCYVVTGSARNDLIAGAWPGTGRFLDIQMWPLVGRELLGDASQPSLFDRWDSPDRFTVPDDPPDVLGYLRLALSGGFPGALRASNARQRERWMRSYVDVTTTRDLDEFGSGRGRPRSPGRFRRYLRACALHTAGVVPDTALAEAADLDRKTAAGHHDILDAQRLIVDTPAWRSNRLRRLTSTPKRYLCDSGLAAWLAQVDFDTARRDPDARGRLLDTYVAAQLRAEAESADIPVYLHHLRSQRGDHEIDLIAEFGARVAAFEIKSASAPSVKDARHLIWLRDNLPAEQFAGGVVLHTGRHRRRLDRDIEAVPIAALWG
ncbi:ATP-binding protein [Candidatus Poriferisodalis sp.]|uniref:ATP-binding protein n=1 Tax=Candidatus Poriferisodalis sp. TaxID=3101277 RepID=UPI003B024BF1